MKTLWKFLIGFGIGIFLAQSYNLPIIKEHYEMGLNKISKFEKSYRKIDKKD